MQNSKLEYQELIDFSPYKSNYKSAFNLFSNRYQKNLNVIDNHIQQYINKRKYETSFTLSDIQISSVQQESNIKVQQKQTGTRYIEPKILEEISQEKESFKNQYFKIIKTVSQKINFLKDQRQTKSIKVKQLSINSHLYKINIQARSKIQYKYKETKPKIQQQFQSKKSYNFLSKFDDKSSGYIKIQCEDQLKSQRIFFLKNQQALTNQRAQQPKKGNKESKKQSEQQKNFSPKPQKYEQSVDSIAFDGVLRNCNCCGKLITKLCFKCPHIYCLAQNCPRKRKKILNQKMLQRMKQQKIQQHYRQRALYEKMKTQNGQNISSKQFSQNRKYINRKKIRDQTSVQFNECETSQGEMESTGLCDQSSKDETDYNSKSKSRNKKTISHNKDKKGKDQGMLGKKHKNLSNNSKRRKQANIGNKLVRTDLPQDKKQKKPNLYFQDSVDDKY